MQIVCQYQWLPVWWVSSEINYDLCHQSQSLKYNFPSHVDTCFKCSSRRGNRRLMWCLINKVWYCIYKSFQHRRIPHAEWSYYPMPIIYICLFATTVSSSWCIVSCIIRKCCQKGAILCQEWFALGKVSIITNFHQTDRGSTINGVSAWQSTDWQGSWLPNPPNIPSVLMSMDTKEGQKR